MSTNAFADLLLEIREGVKSMRSSFKRIREVEYEEPDFTPIEFTLERLMTNLSQIITKKGDVRSPPTKRTRTAEEKSGVAHGRTMVDCATESPIWWPYQDLKVPSSAGTKQSKNKGLAKKIKTKTTVTPPVTEHPKEEEWKEVRTKRAPASKEGAASDVATTRARRPKVRPPAVLVKIATGSSYADTVRALRGPGGVDLEDAGIGAESIKLRRTRDGHL